MLRDRCTAHPAVQVSLNDSVIPLSLKMTFSASVAFILSIGITLNSFGQSRPVKEIAPGVFYYFGDELQQKPANCVWIVFKDFVLVVDANYPWGATEILGEIKKTTSKPVRFLFDTHYHHDHSFGNEIFSDAGATIVSTTATAAEMRTVGKVEWENGSAYSGRDMKPFRRVFPSLTFTDSLIFDDGEKRVELIRLGPAHTAGDGVAWLPKEKILITGDLCVNGNPWGNNVEDTDADYPGWISALDTMTRWNPKIVIPGHGEPGTRATLQAQRAFLADLYRQVTAGIAAGKTKEQLVRDIDLSRHPLYGSNNVSIARSIRGMYDHLIMQQNRK